MRRMGFVPPHGGVAHPAPGHVQDRAGTAGRQPTDPDAEIRGAWHPRSLTWRVGSPMRGEPRRPGSGGAGSRRRGPWTERNEMRAVQITEFGGPEVLTL